MVMICSIFVPKSQNILLNASKETSITILHHLKSSKFDKKQKTKLKFSKKFCSFFTNFRALQIKQNGDRCLFGSV